MLHVFIFIGLWLQTSSASSATQVLISAFNDRIIVAYIISAVLLSLFTSANYASGASTETAAIERKDYRRCLVKHRRSNHFKCGNRPVWFLQTVMAVFVGEAYLVTENDSFQIAVYGSHGINVN